jgi:hypothetical protein
MGRSAVLPEKIPCHVPSWSRPSVTGIVSLVRVSAILMWLGMSSAPSRVCVKAGSSSGTNRSSHATRSRAAEGSAFSITTSEQLVCRQNTLTRPCFTFDRSSSLVTSRVISRNPGPTELNVRVDW